MHLILFIISGFFFYGASMISFFDEIPMGGIFIGILIFVGIAMIFQFIGFYQSKFKDWKRKLGITLLSSSLLCLFGIGTIYLYSKDPVMLKIEPELANTHQNNFSIGLIYNAIVISTGFIIIIFNKNREFDKNS